MPRKNAISSKDASSIMDDVRNSAQTEQENTDQENMLANEIEQKMQAELKAENERLQAIENERKQRNITLDTLVERTVESEFLTKLDKRLSTAKYALSTVSGRKQLQTSVYRSAYRLNVVVGESVQTVLRIGALVHKGSASYNAETMKYDYGMFTLDGQALQKNETTKQYSFYPQTAYGTYQNIGKEMVELSPFQFGEIEGSILTPSYSALRDNTGIVNAFIKRANNGEYKHEWVYQLAEFEDFDLPLYAAIMKRKHDGLTAKQKQEKQYGILASMMNKINKS